MNNKDLIWFDLVQHENVSQNRVNLNLSGTRYSHPLQPETLVTPVTITLSTRNLSDTRYNHPVNPKPQWHPLQSPCQPETSVTPVTITLSTRNLSDTRYSHPINLEPQWHPLQSPYQPETSVTPVTVTLSTRNLRDNRYSHPINPEPQWHPLQSPSSTRHLCGTRYIPETSVQWHPLHSPSSTRDTRYTDSPSSTRNLSDTRQVAIILFKPKPDTRYIQPLQCRHPLSLTAVIAPLLQLLDRPGTPAHPSWALRPSTTR